jgi:hypothetical protein
MTAEIFNEKMHSTQVDVCHLENNCFVYKTFGCCRPMILRLFEQAYYKNKIKFYPHNLDN